ncbi:signal peptide peptidase SppA [Candidatus Woesearchaeota archaeon]|nr:signal peptide peptidase SppA [Candidatus Woesearchaeota archaeon]
MKARNILLIIFIIFLVGFLLLGWGIKALFKGAVQGEITEGANVALISINGPIVVGDHESAFSSDYVTSTEIITFIEDAEKNDNIKAVIFEINSPGGSAVASDEIGQAIKELRETTNKTTVSWIREVGASGAYWVASNTDYIVANKMSMTGSIGVIASYLEFSGLLDKYNITYESLSAGKYKEMGSPFKELSEEERDIFIEELKQIHQYFIEEVANNRKLTKKQVEEFADGRVFLGEKAKTLGLIDEIGGKKEALKYIETKLNITAEIVEYKESVSFLQLLTKLMSEQGFSMGKGLGTALTETNEKGVMT